ncbi:helix-turn-helix domain-containing protein [Microlunatus elymi]|uniref:Helix-turn-helix domain-containing protein n=1 Tax=Microlunatus elymi TaxID=2596828 RepID=A0A516PWC6_9ACTN|nr:helix-turn-helix domain-containing protein [Microlunatus elymi]QDP95261.1 helix-turn-helix domain-containing protein [Microlunatus elymi]
MSQASAIPRIVEAKSLAPKRKRRIRPAADDKLTLAELCDELQVARSTFYDWRAKGNAPRCIKLPNGDLRVRRSDLEQWLSEHEEGSFG